VQDLLPDYVDARLAENSKTLVDAHLHHCPYCSNLCDQLIRIREELPPLKDIDPGNAFVLAVLDKTTRRIESGTRFSKWLSASLRRPAFSVQAAYLGALLLFVAVSWAPRLTLFQESVSQMARIQDEVALHTQNQFSAVGAYLDTQSRRIDGAVDEKLEKARRVVVRSARRARTNLEDTGLATEAWLGEVRTFATELIPTKVQNFWTRISRRQSRI
jgi:hypothetical protein